MYEDLHISDLLFKNKLIITYGSPNPLVTDTIIELGIKILSSRIAEYFILIDADHNIIPRQLLKIDDKIANHIILYKPYSISDITPFLFRLYFNEPRDTGEKLAIVLSSFFIHTNNEFFEALNYDPFIIISLFKSLIRSPHYTYALLDINTFADDFYSLPYSKYLSRYIDLLFYRRKIEDEILFKKTKLQYEKLS